MSPVAETLLEQSLKLSESERAELAAQLLESLPPDEAELTEMEIARRIKELDDGATDAVPWSDARAMILGTDDEPHR